MVLRVAERGYFGFYTEARFPVFLTRREYLPRWDRLKWRDIAVQILRPVPNPTSNRHYNLFDGPLSFTLVASMYNAWTVIRHPAAFVKHEYVDMTKLIEVR